MIRRSQIVALTLGVAAISLLIVGSGGAFTLNQAQLDDGTCGHNLQLGSDKTASSSSTPWFLLFGDGNHASYRIFIDGTSIGTFNSSDVFGNVCIHDTIPLADGPHLLTGNEITPVPTNVVTPFNFSVDTVPPSTPPAPTMSTFSDSGIVGDNLTMFRNVSITGTADLNTSVLVYDNGAAGIGGAGVDATGHWTARTTTLADGTHPLTAAAIDEAGNLSTQSAPLSVRVDGTPPTATLTNPAAGATVNGTVNASATASDPNGIWKVVFTVDGVTKVTDTASPYTYAWDTTAIANGSHTIAAVAYDSAGNTTTSSAAVNVQNGAASVPGAPNLTSATAGSGSVTLAWTAPTTDGGSPITNYRVYRSTASGAETLLATLGNVSGYTDSIVTPGVTYFYQVTAVNGVGEGGRSNERSATPTAASTSPGAPTLTSATAGNTTVTLAWSPPSSDGGSPITNYRVYRSTSSGTETLLTTVEIGRAHV